jgi:hypothetical protein
MPDPAARDALDDYVARRKRAHGAAGAAA